MVVSAGAATALPFATTAAAVLLEPVAIVLLDPVATVPGIVPAGPALKLLAQLWRVSLMLLVGPWCTSV